MNWLMQYFSHGEAIAAPKKGSAMSVLEQGETWLAAQPSARQIVARMAGEYIDNLQPGERFLGLQAEAARHFDIGSEGYGLFISHALHQMAKISMDLDAEHRIVSIVRTREGSHD